MERTEAPVEEAVNNIPAEPSAEVLDDALERVNQEGGVAAHANRYGGDITRCPFLNSMGAAGIELARQMEQAEPAPERGKTIAELLAERKQQQEALAEPAAIAVPPAKPESVPRQAEYAPLPVIVPEERVDMAVEQLAEALEAPNNELPAPTLLTEHEAVVPTLQEMPLSHDMPQTPPMQTDAPSRRTTATPRIIIQPPLSVHERPTAPYEEPGPVIVDAVVPQQHEETFAELFDDEEVVVRASVTLTEQEVPFDDEDHPAQVVAPAAVIAPNYEMPLLSPIEETIEKPLELPPPPVTAILHEIQTVLAELQPVMAENGAVPDNPVVVLTELCREYMEALDVPVTPALLQKIVAELLAMAPQSDVLEELPMSEQDQHLYWRGTHERKQSALAHVHAVIVNLAHQQAAAYSNAARYMLHVLMHPKTARGFAAPAFS